MQTGNFTAYRQINPLAGTTIAVMPTSTAFQPPALNGASGLLVINTGSAEVRLAPGNDATVTIGPHSAGAARIPPGGSVFFSSAEQIANAPWLAAHSTLGNGTIKVCAADARPVWLAPAPDLGTDATASPFDSTLPPPFVSPASSGTFGPFSASGTTTLAVGTQTAFTPLAGTGNVLKITNSGASQVNFMVSATGPTPTPIAGQSLAVGAGATIYLNFSTVVPNFLTAIMQGGTATLSIVRGNATFTPV